MSHEVLFVPKTRGKYLVDTVVVLPDFHPSTNAIVCGKNVKVGISIATTRGLDMKHVGAGLHGVFVSKFENMSVVQRKLRWTFLLRKYWLTSFTTTVVPVSFSQAAATRN